MKHIATLLFIGLASTMLCGFIALGQSNHAMNHMGSDSVEHHYSMLTETSTALVSNIAASVTALISIIVLAYVVARGFALSLLNTQLVYARIPIEPDERLGKRTKLIRWLSLLEHSPTFV